MSAPTPLGQRVWFPYFRSIEGEHDSGYGLFEVGYVDAGRSRIILETRTDVVTIEPPSIGRVQLDHRAGRDEVMIGPAGNKQLWPYWKEVSAASAEIEWSEQPPKVALAPRMPVGPGEVDPHGRADLGGRTRAVPPDWPPQVFDGETAEREACRFIDRGGRSFTGDDRFSKPEPTDPAAAGERQTNVERE